MHCPIFRNLDYCGNYTDHYSQQLKRSRVDLQACVSRCTLLKMTSSQLVKLNIGFYLQAS